MKLPDRWLKYRNCEHIRGTRFVACKTPLRQGYNRTLQPENSFTPSDLLEKYPQIQLVIDLTFTQKYYNENWEFQKKGVQYVKIRCKGHEIPHADVYREFCNTVENFLEYSPEDAYIGVHCTHGVNRTGYLIARYMIDKLGYSPEEALRVFATSRGHKIERDNYVQDLLSMSPSSSAGETGWTTVRQKRHRRRRLKPKERI